MRGLREGAPLREQRQSREQQDEATLAPQSAARPHRDREWNAQASAGLHILSLRGQGPESRLKRTESGFSGASRAVDLRRGDRRSGRPFFVTPTPQIGHASVEVLRDFQRAPPPRQPPPAPVDQDVGPPTSLLDPRSGTLRKRSSRASKQGVTSTASRGFLHLRGLDYFYGHFISPRQNLAFRLTAPLHAVRRTVAPRKRGAPRYKLRRAPPLP